MIVLSKYTNKINSEKIKEYEKWILKEKKLKGNTRNVYSFIVGLSIYNNGACKVKMETIAEKLCIGRTTVYRAINKLLEMNLIAKHNETKMNGINGANVYSIIFLDQNETTNETTEMKQRVTHGNTYGCNDKHGNLNTESFSFNLYSNNYVNKNVSNNVNACDSSYGLAIILKDIYCPQSSVEKEIFNELKKIAFGRIKQYMEAYKLSYPQIESIVVNCMKALISKSGVRNQAAMFSGMIKRQVEQLIKPSNNSYNERKFNSKEKVPDWFNDRNIDVVSSTDESVDFEIERQKILEKIGGC